MLFTLGWSLNLSKVLAVLSHQFEEKLKYFILSDSVFLRMLFIRRLLILQFLRHAEFISASLRLKEA